MKTGIEKFKNIMDVKTCDLLINHLEENLDNSIDFNHSDKQHVVCKEIMLQPHTELDAMIFKPIEKFIPSTNQATNALAIAVIATAGATATPIVLRIVKPILTKIWKTIQKKMGKKVDMPSRAEIRANKYREKKGLPPLKKK